MANKNQSIGRVKIFLGYDGKTYRAEYFVESGTLTIEAPSKDDKPAKISSQIKGSRIDHLAPTLLRELIETGRVKEHHP